MPARHAGREVAAAVPEHDHAAAGHVLAAMVADTLDDRVHATVADGEALAGHPAHVGLAARRAVERDVADDDVLLGHETVACRGRWTMSLPPESPFCPSSRWRRPRG